MSPTRTAGPTRSARRSTSLVPRGEPTADFPAHRAAQRVDAGQARPLADQQRVLEGRQHAGLGQRQRIAGALQCPELAAVERVEGLHGAVDAEHEHALAGHQRRGRDTRGQRLAPLDLPPARSTTSSLSRVTTAAKRPSLPTPALSLRAGAAAPDLAAGVGVQREHGAVVAGDGELAPS